MYENLHQKGIFSKSYNRPHEIAAKDTLTNFMHFLRLVFYSSLFRTRVLRGLKCAFKVLLYSFTFVCVEWT